MNCKDFREIADSYLSDELLVETNHEILRHLENCAECRTELSDRRNLRERLRFSVKNSQISQINPAFTMRLKANLEAQSKRKKVAWHWASVFSNRLIFVAASILILALGIGVIRRNWKSDAVENVSLHPNPTVSIIPSFENSPLPIQNASFIKIKNDAVDDHKFCALKFSLKDAPITLEEAAQRFEKYNKGLDLAIIKPLREVFGSKVELLEAHSCIINGRRFAHVVLKYQNRPISVLVTTHADFSDPSNNGNAISCQSVENLQIACFETVENNIFVISDLSESENLKIARTITASVKKHLQKDEKEA
jgi:hypothetical protein